MATPSARNRELNQLRILANSAPVVLFTIDKNGIFTLSEGGALRRLGLHPGEAVGQSAVDVYRDAPQVLATIRIVLAGTPQSGIVELPGCTFETHYAPTRDGNGVVDGLIGLSIDTTDHATSEQRFASVCESITEGIVIADAHGSIIHINRSVEVMLGHTGNELIGQPLSSIFTEGSNQLFLEALALTQGSDVPRNSSKAFDLECPRKDGTTFPVQMFIASWTETEQRRYTTILRERTLDNESTALLAADERRLDALARSSVVMLAEFDEQGRIVYAGNGHHAAFGYAPEEMIGRSLAEFVHPNDIAYLTETFRESFANRTDGDFHGRMRLVSGEWRWFHMLITWYELPDGTNRGVGIAVDVHDRVEARNQAQARSREIRTLNQRLQQYLVERSEFLSYYEYATALTATLQQHLAERNDFLTCFLETAEKLAVMMGEARDASRELLESAHAIEEQNLQIHDPWQ